MKKFEKISDIKSLPTSVLAVYSFDYTSQAVAAKSKVGQLIAGKVKLLESSGVVVNVLSKNNTTPFDDALAKMNISLKNNYTPLKKMLSDLSPRKIFFGEKSSIINEDYCEDICFSSFKLLEQIMETLDNEFSYQTPTFDIDDQVVCFEDSSCKVEEAMLAAILLGYNFEIKDESFIIKTYLSKVS